MPSLAAPLARSPDDTADSPFALGWDHAHYRLTPPLERLCINPRLRDGFQAGRAAFGRHTLAADAPVREWLQLRLEALACGAAFESVRLTPRYLARLAVPHCPVTREPLTGSGEAAGWRVARVRLDAGYAAGNLARMSLRAVAGAAMPGRGENAHAAALTATQRRRLAVLAGFVQPLAHEAATAVPLLVLPPPGLLLFNPAQALQTVVTRSFAAPTPNLRLAALREALPDATSRDDFDAFIAAYGAALAEVTAYAAGADAAAAPAHWALEDAWADARACERWKRFARGLGAARCEALALQAAPRGSLQRPEPLATEGWALESAGRAAARRTPPLRLPASLGIRRAGPSQAAGAVPKPTSPRAGEPGRSHRQPSLFTH
jgi:hypothetical protein